MAEKINMSLDDIIQQNPSAYQFGIAQRGRGSQNRGTFNRRGSFRGRNNNYRFATSYQFSRTTDVWKRKPLMPERSWHRYLTPPTAPRFYRGANRGGRFLQQRGRPFSGSFSGPFSGSFSGPFSGGPGRISQEHGKLNITNLDYGVNDSDLNELFVEFGDLLKCGVNYDSEGNSTGTASVVFKFKKDAIRAINEYRDVPLDGRPMKLQLLNPDPPIEAPMEAPGGQNWRPRYPRQEDDKRAGLATTNQKPKMDVTAEDLDAELDAYLDSMETE